MEAHHSEPGEDIPQPSGPIETGANEVTASGSESWDPWAARGRRAFIGDEGARWLNPDGSTELIAGNQKYKFVITNEGELYLSPGSERSSEVDDEPSRQDEDEGVVEEANDKDTHDEAKLTALVDCIYDRTGFPRGNFTGDYISLQTPSIDWDKRWMKTLVKTRVSPQSYAELDLEDEPTVVKWVMSWYQHSDQEHVSVDSRGRFDLDFYNADPELQPISQTVFSGYLGMVNGDRLDSKRRSRAKKMLQALSYGLRPNLESELQSSSRSSSLSSVSAASVAHADLATDECDTNCWLRLEHAEVNLDPCRLAALWCSSQPGVNQPKHIYNRLVGKQFRLLRILGGSGRTIQCTLIASDLSSYQDAKEICGNVANYEALSYTWGSSERSCQIQLNSNPFPVTRNLFTALNEFRLSDQARIMWIDAICINQDDLQERAQQVQHMKSIYECAKMVIVWLGESANNSGIAVASMIALDQEDVRMQVFQRKHTALCLRRLRDIYEAEIALLERPWFRRSWIRQEVSSAKKITVCCGNQEMPWYVMKRSMMRLSRILNRLKEDESHEHKPMPRHQLKHITNLHRNWIPGEPIMFPCGEINSLWHNHAGGFVDLLMSGRGFDATNPRDKVYSILGMAEVPILSMSVAKIEAEQGRTEKPWDGTGSEPFMIDYSDSVSEVYQYTVKYLINRDLNLDILCILSSNRGASSSDLPSWVPDWRISAGEHELRKHLEYFTSKVGAAGFTKAMIQDYEETGAIKVQAYWLGTIDVLHDLTSSFVDSIASASSENGAILATEFQPDNHSFRWSQTEQGGQQCLVPTDTTIGDDVFVLLGAKLPFVLREVSAADEKRLTFAVVGPCCVPGLMFGRLIRVAQDQNKKPVVFWLV